MRHPPALSGTAPRPAWLPIGLGTLLRLVQIWMPVLGVHSWRQADTAAMARHFSQAGTPIWLPQIDWGGASAGFVESEFPLYPFLVSRLYSLMGVPVPGGDRCKAGADVEPETRTPQQPKQATGQGLEGGAPLLGVACDLHHQQGKTQPEQWNHLDQAG